MKSGHIWRRVYLAIVVLSSINYGDLISADSIGVVVERVTPIRTVLSGDVNVSLQIPGYLVNATTPRTLFLTVMEHRTHVRLRTLKVDVDRQNLTVQLPCDLFDHAGQYGFAYKFSGNGPTGKLNTTLSLEWGKMTVEAPRNHTTLTRFGYIWVYHDRSCLPKSRRYRDKIKLYYLKENRKVVITHRVVRKVKNGKQKGPRRRMRMGFSCDLFDIAQTYFFEYVSGFNNASLARSEPVFVRWSKHSLYTPSKTILPCTNSFVVSFNAPECHKTTDVIRVYEQNSGRFVTERPALPGHTAVFFPCTLFNDYIKGYCFRYVSKSTMSSKAERIQATHCVSTLEPGKSIYDGWSSWSYWNLCSNSCGQGRKYRYRFCLSLTSSKDKNKECGGRAVETKPCVLRPCPETRNACACGCRLTEPEGMITSSPQLFKKPGRSQCTWRINVPGNKRVKLWFDALKLDGDYVFIRDGNDSSANLLAKIKADDYEDAIISSGNSMYIYYYHNGKWINGTRRGFTASYKVEDTSVAAVFASSRRTLGTAEISFLAIFIVGILIMGSLFLIVFLKLRRQHRFSASSGSSTTSESTIRSAGTPSPLEDEACINEPLKSTKDTRTKKSRGKRDHKERQKERRKRRNEMTCEGNPIPRCSCALVSEFDSGSGTNSYSDGSPQRHNSGVYRTLERTIDDYTVCDCPMCLRHQREYHTQEPHFGSPEKKYYGDWMIQESYMEESRQNYRNSFPQYV